MQSRLVYMDESGDSGMPGSSDIFILSSISIATEDWRKNHKMIYETRVQLRDQFGFRMNFELHTNELLRDRDPYRDLGWTAEDKRSILQTITELVTRMDIQIISIVIDKVRLASYCEGASVLETALSNMIQRIEDACDENWNYMIITDEGSVGAMRTTAKRMQHHNPRAAFEQGERVAKNYPIRFLVEDIFEKNSKNCYFIQLCDFVSCFVQLYYSYCLCENPLPKRMQGIIDRDFILWVMNRLNESGKFNLNACCAPQ